MSRRTSAGTAFALFIAFLLACNDHDEFREDVILCEEAVAYLRSCCPAGRAPSIECHYSYDANVTDTSSSSSSSSSSDSGDDGGGGCHDREITPDLDVDSSRAILSRRCVDLAPRCRS
jgi:hypothetical protein